MDFLFFFNSALLGIGLAMDAFSVALANGLDDPCMRKRKMTGIAMIFGLFQGLMPFIGWVLGKQFESYITDFDHWIAFALLAFIGGKMLVEALKKDDDGCCCDCGAFDVKDVLVLAVATSIDALAVGITFATLKMQLAETVVAVLLIAAVTFGFSYAGVAIGNRFGAKFKSKAEFAGGVILVLIGVKILLEHLGVITF